MDKNVSLVGVIHVNARRILGMNPGDLSNDTISQIHIEFKKAQRTSKVCDGLS